MKRNENETKIRQRNEKLGNRIKRNEDVSYDVQKTKKKNTKAK